MELLLGFIVGAFVGWTVPQPAWAKALFDKFIAKITGK